MVSVRFLIFSSLDKWSPSKPINLYKFYFYFLDMDYTTPPPFPCKNHDGDDDCNEWAQDGDCTVHEWKTYMYMNCKLACKMCDD